MRVCSYETAGGQPSYGLIKDGRIFDAGASFRARYPDLRSVLEAGALQSLETAAAAFSPLDPASVTLLPPVPRPDKILCIGLNYMTHIQETGRERPAKPSIFTRYPSSLVGHGVPLIRPRVSDWFDFEGELAVVIGKAGRAISAADAAGHIAGYTCFNDGSIRDFQRHTTQFWAGKNFDRSGSVGPWLVTADELADPEAQHMTTRLNGEVVQSTPISDLAFSIPALIEYLSTVTELLPGDVIATGTPSGVGLFREPKLFMKPGDRIEVEITGIGTLANMIQAED
ncbi:5-oxopent-3-ene-1,2,5-tricarboxylate decarboxylase [Pannonibacter phragmitetus]|uniref:fumarylacetoacetate hydrolase family protein n=1 Tax=Pannonibacter phragmitetus TaxID=121719 RepID=UPI00067C6219|nr:fumarylacetoacetate hydrolase family protein [Pannonibacter phragmitetus]KND18201.1 5-oxopent-3-ene-1,2,5-tricarboxylate decarboxylase [Pannonibacter phragmitetus]